MTVVREATADDAGFLESMLLEAFNWRGDDGVDLAAMRADPHVTRYVDGWPRPGDFGVVAVDAAGEPTGAAWARFFSGDDPGYGFVAPDVPELTVAVHRDSRGKGIGRAMLTALVAEGRRRGHPAFSLSAEDGNAARALYLSLGFTVAGRVGNSDTMVLRLPG